jgi:hypothetical protein
MCQRGHKRLEAVLDIRLADQFTPPNFERALAAFSRAKPDWPMNGRYKLYKLGRVAFDSDASEIERRNAVETMYDTLIRYWGILRGFPVPSCWDATRVFDVLTRECGLFSRQVSDDLMRIDVSRSFESMLMCVQRFEGVKPMTSDFPHMATAKLLHFYNPTLFPIYDRAVVWDQVCQGAFKQDYDRFCADHGFKVWEPSARFNVYYVWWASEIMKTADEGIADVFATWFAEQAGVSIEDPVIRDCQQYWGAMFEIAAIGAASL